MSLLFSRLEVLQILETFLLYVGNAQLSVYYAVKLYIFHCLFIACLIQH